MPTTKLSTETNRMLRHILAAIAFRASRSLRDAPAGFEQTRLVDDGMSASELVNHMTNVLAFAVATINNSERLRHEPLPWRGEVDRFYAILTELDERLAKGIEIEQGMEFKLVQGPFADAFSHIGQLNAMRRIAGVPIPGISYVKADIRVGSVALVDQPV